MYIRSMAEKKAKIANKEKWDKVVQTKDKKRIMRFAAYMDDFDEGIVEMGKLPGHETKVKGIVDKTKSTNSETSAIKHNQQVVSSNNSAKKRRWIMAAESKTEGAVEYTIFPTSVESQILCPRMATAAQKPRRTDTNYSCCIVAEPSHRWAHTSVITS